MRAVVIGDSAGLLVAGTMYRGLPSLESCRTLVEQDTEAISRRPGRSLASRSYAPAATGLDLRRIGRLQPPTETCSDSLEPHIGPCPLVLSSFSLSLSSVLSVSYSDGCLEMAPIHAESYFSYPIARPFLFKCLAPPYPIQILNP